MKIYKFKDLQEADLSVDALYKSSADGNIRGEALYHLLGVANMGGFRKKKGMGAGEFAFIVLYSDMSDADWPDSIDFVHGLLTYYGDNKKPGQPLEETHIGGNRILSTVFEQAHGDYETRAKVPPFLIFTKGNIGRDVIFRGLAVPGASSLSQTEDLVAIWKVKEGFRFQNYRAIFTILDEALIERDWLNDLINGNPLSLHCPDSWRTWVETGTYTPLKAEETREYRDKQEQLPQNDLEKSILDLVFSYFADNPYLFESFACELVKKMDQNVISANPTQASRDGGRDGIGRYRIGLKNESISVEFSIEAKCYSTTNSVGVRELSRLISRLRHRQFGVLVTTSYVAKQAYKEIRDDNHPIIVIAGGDIARLLKSNSLGNTYDLKKWLEKEFPA